ncbi:MAG: spore coat associated protein CotJA [Ruminococcus sp.]|nr:spore coat associated protein CotJA [Ruminococcus sp.]
MEMIDKSLLGALFASEEETKPEAGACPMPKTILPEELPYAMAYVPFQQWQKPYDSDAALQRGTIFPALDKPFIGEEAVRNDK